MLEGHDDHWDVLGCGRRELQRQRRFAHAGGASQQVQSLVQAAEQVVELAEPRGHPQHGAASGLPLQAARFGIRQDLGQQCAGPLQAASKRAAQDCLYPEGFLFQQGRDVRSRCRLIEERLR